MKRSQQAGMRFTGAVEIVRHGGELRFTGAIALHRDGFRSPVIALHGRKSSFP
jgi:hypothetical protein